MIDWKESKLGELFNQSNQGVNTTTEKVNYSESGVPVIRAKNIRAYNIDFNDVTYVDIETFERLKDSVKPLIGDILYTNIGSQMGNAAVVKSDLMFVIAWNVLRIVPSKDLESLFLMYLLNNPETKDFIKMQDSSSTMPFVSGSVIKALEFTIPEIKEQKAIVEVLTSLDDKIDLLQQQNKTIEKMAETLYSAWVFEKEYTNRIGDLIELQNGYAFKSKNFQDSGEHRVLKIKNISGGIVDIETSDFVSEETVSSVDEKFKIKTGDVLLAMTGAKIGKMGIIPKTNSELWLNQRVGLFKEKYNGSRFLAYLHLKSDYGKDYIENAATGSAQPNISGTGIENCEFPEISEQEIIDYSSQLAPLYEKLIFNLGQIQKLEALRDTLLPKLMSGEVRLEING